MPALIVPDRVVVLERIDELHATERPGRQHRCLNRRRIVSRAGAIVGRAPNLDPVDRVERKDRDLDAIDAGRRWCGRDRREVERHVSTRVMRVLYGGLMIGGVLIVVTSMVAS